MPTGSPRATARVALAAALLPFITAHLCYVLSAAHGYVDWCIPYIDGCSSISKAGRNPPAYFVFKGLMIPSAVLMIFYWHLNGAWLRTLGDRSRLGAAIPWLGLIAGVFLILYTVALGHKGDEYRLMRRTGVILHFSMTYLAELFLSVRLLRLAEARSHHLPKQLLRGMIGLCALVLVIGIVHDVAETIDPRYEEWEDALEWNVALLINLHYLLVWRAWLHTGFHLRTHAGT